MNKSLDEILQIADCVHIAGSRLYGTSTENSDIDLRGFWLPPAEVLLGRDNFDQIESSQQDICIYSLPKFFKLLEIGSPNVLETLFVPENLIQRSTDVYKIMIEYRHLFINDRIIKPIFGFSEGQWLNVTGYNTRKLGQKRKELVAQFGYDPKAAHHACRVLYQGYQLFRFGQINYPLDLRDFLLEIKLGNFSLEKVTTIYNDFRTMTQEAERNTSLKSYNKKEVDSLYFDIIKPFLKDFYEK